MFLSTGTRLSYHRWFEPDPQRPSTFFQGVPEASKVDMGDGEVGVESLDLGLVIKTIGHGETSQCYVYKVWLANQDVQSKVLMGRYGNPNDNDNKPIGWRSYVPNEGNNVIVKMIPLCPGEPGNEIDVRSVPRQTTFESLTYECASANLETYVETVVGYYLNRLRFNGVGRVLKPITTGFSIQYRWDKVVNRCHRKVKLPKTGEFVGIYSNYCYALTMEKGDQTLEEALPQIFKFEAKRYSIMVSILLQIYHALEAADHSLSFVHNDLHTGNVMLVNAEEDTDPSGRDWIFERNPKESDRYGTRRPLFLPRTFHLNGRIMIIDFGRSHIKVPFSTATAPQYGYSFKKNAERKARVYDLDETSMRATSKGFLNGRIPIKPNKGEDIRHLAFRLIVRIEWESLKDDYIGNIQGRLIDYSQGTVNDETKRSILVFASIVMYAFAGIDRMYDNCDEAIEALTKALSLVHVATLEVVFLALLYEELIKDEALRMLSLLLFTSSGLRHLRSLDTSPIIGVEDFTDAISKILQLGHEEDYNSSNVRRTLQGEIDLNLIATTFMIGYHTREILCEDKGKFYDWVFDKYSESSKRFDESPGTVLDEFCHRYPEFAYKGPNLKSTRSPEEKENEERERTRAGKDMRKERNVNDYNFMWDRFLQYDRTKSDHETFTMAYHDDIARDPNRIVKKETKRIAYEKKFYPLEGRRKR